MPKSSTFAAALALGVSLGISVAFCCSPAEGQALGPAATDQPLPATPSTGLNAPQAIAIARHLPDTYWKLPDGGIYAFHRIETKRGEQIRLDWIMPDHNYYTWSAAWPEFLKNQTARYAYDPDLKQLFVLEGPDRLKLSKGRVKDGKFLPSDPPKIRYASKMSGAEITDLQQTLDRRAAAKRAKGNSGLLGGLMMATGAVLAGGNTEVVMGAAMKGVEMTTDNQMTRNVLAGQGDAMIAAGTERSFQSAPQQSASAPASSRASIGSAPQDKARGASAGAGVVPPSQNVSGSMAMRRVSARAIISVGMQPTERNTRNPMCYSTPLTISYMSAPNHDGDTGRADAEVARLHNSFLAKCGRYGQVIGTVHHVVEGIHSGSIDQTITSEDVRVPMP